MHILHKNLLKTFFNKWNNCLVNFFLFYMLKGGFRVFITFIYLIYVLLHIDDIFSSHIYLI